MCVNYVNFFFFFYNSLQVCLFYRSDYYISTIIYKCFFRSVKLSIFTYSKSSSIFYTSFIKNTYFIFRVGLDLINGTIRDNKKAGVLEPTMSKIKCLKFATEAAITILRIDDLVKIEPEQKEDPNSYQNARASGRL